MMRISTAEIKMLIKECVKTGGMYTATDFGKYIKTNSGKEFTRGQISGAISQLVDTRDIVRVGRGLYSKDMKSLSNKNPAHRDEKDNKLQRDIYNTLSKIENDLAQITGKINIWELEAENFEIITKMRELKKTIEDIKNQCKQIS